MTPNMSEHVSSEILQLEIFMRSHQMYYLLKAASIDNDKCVLRSEVEACK